MITFIWAVTWQNRPVWSESSLSAWRNLGFLATHQVHSEDSDQTDKLIWVFAGRILILLVLSWGGSFNSSWVLTVWHNVNRAANCFNSPFINSPVICSYGPVLCNHCHPPPTGLPGWCEKCARYWPFSHLFYGCPMALLSERLLSFII